MFLTLVITVTWQGALREGCISSKSSFEVCRRQNDISQLHPQEVPPSGAGGPRALQHRLEAEQNKRHVWDNDLKPHPPASVSSILFLTTHFDLGELQMNHNHVSI